MARAACSPAYALQQEAGSVRPKNSVSFGSLYPGGSPEKFPVAPGRAKGVLSTHLGEGLSRGPCAMEYGKMARHDLVDGRKTSEDWQRLAAPIAVLPVGAFEQHGPHLPLLTDTLLAEYFARHVADALGAALLPALPISLSHEQAGFRGSLSLRAETFMHLIRDLAGELEQQGFTRLVIVNAHGGNGVLGPVVREWNRSDRGIKAVLANCWDYDSSQALQEPPGEDIHAGAWETSLMLALFSDVVGDYAALTAAPLGQGELQRDLNHLGMGMLRPDGVWGDPSKATAEAGEQIAASIKANLLAAVQERLAWFDQYPAYAGGGPVIIRPMQQQDINAVVRLSSTAGWTQQREDWALFYGLNPGGCFVAQRSGRVAGTVIALDYGGKVGWIAMLLVDPAQRRRGIGAQLLEQALKRLEACRCVKLDATSAGKRVYATLDFEEEYTLTRMKAAALKPVPEGASVWVRPMRGADMPTVAGLDREAFGVARTEALQALRAMAPEYAQVSEDQGQVTGFCLGRRRNHFAHIGPVTAPDLDTAKSLALTVLKSLASREVVIDVPRHATEFKQWLASLGFAKQRTFTRMYLRENTFPGLAARVFAICGPELG